MRRSCSRSSRPSRASPRPAAPCRRSPASSSRPTPAAPSCAPPTWRSACAFRSRPRSCARAPSCCPRACCSTSSAQLPAGDVTLELRAGRAGRRGRRRAGDVPHPHAARRGLPAAARAGRRHGRRRARPQAFVETIARVARSASRDETRPILTGILVSAAGQRAADGRDGLLPAERQGDAARGRRSRRLRGQRPGPRAAGARADRRRAPRPTSSAIAVRANQVVFQVGGDRAVVAADRGSVPELPPAAAREPTSTS